MTVNWKKIILWTIAAVLLLVIGTLTTGVILLQHSASFRGFLLAKVESSVADSTGAQLKVRDFNVHLSNLSVDVYGVVVRGTEPRDKPPLFAAEHLNAGITVDSLIRRTWHFRDIVVDHPVVHLAVNKAGESNLPRPKTQSSGKKTDLFALGIRRLVLDRGEAYYNDRKTPLDADLHHLEFVAGYDPTQRRYEGHLSYDDGHIQYGRYAPLPHSLDAGFSATPDRLSLDRLELSVGQSHAVLNATVQDYGNDPKVQANYDASLATGEFARLLKNPSLPSGAVRLTGVVRYQEQPGRSFLDAASVWGMLNSPELNVRTTNLQTAVRNLSAKYRLEDGNLEVQNLRAEILDGRLEGALTVRGLSGRGQGRLQASLKDISLDLLQRASGTSALREAHLVGNVSADAQASWVKSLKNLVAHSDVTIHAALGQKPATPLNGVIHADYSAASRQVALRQSYFRTPQTSITLDGKVSQLSQLQIRMHSNDLHELESLAANFRTASASGQPPQPLDLYGAATLNASVSGSLQDPRIKGHLIANRLRVKGSAWRVLRADISANPSHVVISNGRLQAETQGQLSFDLQTGLKHWAYSPSSPIAIELSASQMSAADLERIANRTDPISGTLDMRVSVRGSQLAPRGQGKVTLANAKISGEPVQNISVDFHGDGQALDTTLAVRMPAGTAQGQATYYPRTQSYQLQVQAHDFRLEKLQTVSARNLQIAGGVNLDASGRGSLKSPELLATVDIPRLQVQKETIQNIRFRTHLQNQVADLALDSSVAQTYVKGRGSIGIQAPYMANIKLDTGRIAFAPLLALYAPAQAGDISGQTELHFSIQGPLQEKNRVEAHLQIPVFTASYRQLQLAAAKPIRVDYRNGVAVLQPTSIQGTETNIQLQASVPVNNVKAAALLVQGTVDLRIAQLLQPTLQSSGQVQFDIDSRRFDASSFGRVRIVNASFHTAEAPVGLDNANGVISVTKDRLQISSFQGQVGGGTVTARGGMAYRPAMEFDLALAANQVRLRYPEGLRTMFNSNLAMTGSPQAATISGQVMIQHVSFTPDFELSSFIEQFTGSGGGATSAGFSRNVKLSIAVQSTSQMQLQSSQVSISGEANLRVAGTLAQPVILGRTTLNRGEIFLAGNRYVLQSGTLDFLNPVRTAPVVNIHARTTIDQYNITLNIDGPLERLRTEYTSDPALPPVDIINLIAFGKTTEAAGANPAPTGAMGAQSLIAQGISSQVSGRIAKFAGISHLSIDPALGGNGQDPGARIAVQQRVTSNLFVTFATDVTSTQRQAIEVEYQLNRRWSVSGVRDQNGGFGVDGHYHKDF